MKNLDILYEDEFCLIINKASGLAVQGGEKVGLSLDSILAKNIQPRPLLVHRLDKDTSGLILVAKTKAAAAHYAQVFSGKEQVKKTEKTYLALCCGIPPQEKGCINRDLEFKGRSGSAVTDYQLVSQASGYSLLRLELGTGRMHQIRRHLASMGLPILGDDKYGDFGLNRRLRRAHGIKKLMLHAWRLKISGPSGLVCAEAPLPEYFIAALGEFTIVFP